MDFFYGFLTEDEYKIPVKKDRQGYLMD